jgi:Thymidylate synthase complementing protein
MSHKLNLYQHQLKSYGSQRSTAKVSILNSSQTEYSQITTFLIEGFPKPLVGEIAKHRLIAMSCQSSRAMTLSATINQIKQDPYLPSWTNNQKGMSGKRMLGWKCWLADKLYIFGSRLMILLVQILVKTTNAHKQNLNRLLEPWMKVSLILTATEWDNFFNLRCAENCQDDFRIVAREMRRQLDLYYPRLISNGEWHYPYSELTLEENVAKVASVSYSNHNKDRKFEDSKRLFNQLYSDKHYVPFEHCLQAVIPGDSLDAGNFLDPGAQVFDIFQLDISTCSYNIDENEAINTGSFRGFMPLRRFLENQLPIRNLPEKKFVSLSSFTRVSPEHDFKRFNQIS